eukprot:1690255-Alexandrium_andersonii.AAC.1
MDSTQLADVAEINDIARELERTSGRADWRAATPSHSGWCSQPIVEELRRALGQCRGEAPGPDAWRAEELAGLPAAAVEELLFLLGACERAGWPPALKRWRQ